MGESDGQLRHVFLNACQADRPEAIDNELSSRRRPAFKAASGSLWP